MFVRFLACALMGWAVAEVALYVAVCHHKHLPVEIIPSVVKFLPLLIGLVMLVCAKSIAEWLADKLDL
ncbi:MAG: hypothetical protein RL616_135 [Verrucomicrobiota bacterium]